MRFILPDELRSNTITGLYLPNNMTYADLHDVLKERGFVIYAGQGQLNAKIFRIANMGDLSMEDFEEFIKNFKDVINHGETVSS